MADDVMRWSVTYTKQIKQKRKVYQDGFLELHSTSHKVKLYDDCDKLLESKIVKLDDAVKSGETLTFGVYLVDIGDPHGESKPIPNPTFQRDKNVADKDGTLKYTKTSKGNLHFRKPSSINLSPSQKIIRDFKSREVQKYSSSPGCQDKMKADLTEWQVLYTTQLSQKAKKFHDGILKVGISGLRGKQAVLYDETGRQLDTRFLKNEEIVKVGELMKFDGHIVDIVELRDTNVDGSNCYSENTVQSKSNNEHVSEFKKSETNKSSTATSCTYTEKSNITEWDVMYTSQVTQKAKKYNDGILKLASSGIYGRQEATLLAEDGTVLCHKYLKLSEKINSGSPFNMTIYLVEVGEPRKYSEGECPNKASTTENENPKIRSIDVDNINLGRRIPATTPIFNEPPKSASSLQGKVKSTSIKDTKPSSDEKPPKRTSSLQDTDSKLGNSVADKLISSTICQNKPLRDASAILSFLKKPGTQRVSEEKVHEEEHLPSQALKIFSESTQDVDVGGQAELFSSKVVFTSNTNEPAKEIEDRSNTKISGSNTTIDSSMHDVSFDGRKGFENTKSRNDDFPSFDLGFD